MIFLSHSLIKFTILIAIWVMPCTSNDDETKIRIARAECKRFFFFAAMYKDSPEDYSNVIRLGDSPENSYEIGRDQSQFFLYTTAYRQTWINNAQSRGVNAADIPSVEEIQVNVVDMIEEYRTFLRDNPNLEHPLREYCARIINTVESIELFRLKPVS